MKRLQEVFRTNSGYKAFLVSVMTFALAYGLYRGVIDNYLAESVSMSAFDKGVSEFFRELPGLLLVFVLALLYKVSDWKVMRLGTLISMAGVALLLVPADKIFVTAFIMIWSMGEHLVMPVRSSIAMQVAKEEHAGQSLGFLTGMMNFGSVAGSLIVAALFFVGVKLLDQPEKTLFHVLWIFIAVLMLVSTVSTFSKNAPNQPSKRPRLFLARKFSKFYALELFYGARKQIFITFAPYVLIREYDFTTAQMAMLMGFCAFVNIFAGPAVGKITDRWGYRNVMIWDTVILSGVCLMYGYAGKIFPVWLVSAVLCMNFLLDTILSTTALATNIYVRTLAADRDELTSTLSTGISTVTNVIILSVKFENLFWYYIIKLRKNRKK